MRKLLALVFLLTLITPAVHAGFFEDVFDLLGGVAEGISETVFGTPRMTLKAFALKRRLNISSQSLRPMKISTTNSRLVLTTISQSAKARQKIMKNTKSTALKNSVLNRSVI